MLGALLSTLARPRWWAMSLAAFLVRGGVLLILLPIVALPSIAGLAAAFGQVLVGFVFGEPSTAALLLAGVLVLAIATWLVASANVGAWLDIALAREAAEDEDLLATGPALERVAAHRAAGARLLAHLPTAVAIAFAAGRIIDVGYAEFIQPGNPTTPILLRVAAREHRIQLDRSWMVGDILDDVEAGHAAGCRSVLLDVGHETEWRLGAARTPDVITTDLETAARAILRRLA